MKKWWYLLFIVILLSFSVNAFSKEDSINWLENNINYQNSNIEESSFTILSLNTDKKISKTDPSYTIFEQRGDEEEGCFPQGNCNTKDTSLAILTKYNLGADYKKSLDWLNNNLGKSDVEDWYLQIQTTGSGKCTVIYDEDQEKIIVVNGPNKLKIEGEAGEYDWINLKINLGVDLDEPIEKIIVDCTKPTDSKVNDISMLMSLLRIVNNNEFYIYQELQGRINTLEINNACYSNTLGGSCDKEASFYAAWALKKINTPMDKIIVLPYLEKSAETDLDYAMLLSITGEERHAQLLIDKQHTLGWWGDKDIIATSFAINALKTKTKYSEELSKAKSWLDSQQISEEGDDKGSFGDLLSTATATYLVYLEQGSSTTTSICGNNIIESGEQCDDGNLVNGDRCSSTCKDESTLECVSNLDCELEEICDDGSCVLKCKSDDDCTNSNTEQCNLSTGKCELREICDNDGICDVGETASTCQSDCSNKPECESDFGCNSGEVCSSSGECEAEPFKCTSDDECSDSKECNVDTGICEEKQSSKAWIGLIILVIVLIGGGSFAYTKFFKKPKKPTQPSFLDRKDQGNKPRSSFQRSSFRPSSQDKVDSGLEHELDKSIKETERLLKK